MSRTVRTRWSRPARRTAPSSHRQGDRARAANAGHSPGAATTKVRQMSRPARVIALANQKGGAANATTTLNLGVGLHDLGARVLAVDLDPQSNLSMSQGIDVEALEVGMFHVLTGRAAISEIVETREIDIAPAGIELAGAERALHSSIRR